MRRPRPPKNLHQLSANGQNIILSKLAGAINAEAARCDIISDAIELFMTIATAQGQTKIISQIYGPM